MTYASHLQRYTTPEHKLYTTDESGNKRCVKDIYLAAIEGDVECIEANIALGVEVNKVGQPAKIWGPRFEKSGLFSATPLHYACAYGRELAVKCLLKHGARPDMRSASGLNSKDYARRRNYVSILVMLEEA